MEITVQYEIRQVQQVHEEKMSYDLHMLLFLTWTDKRLIGLTANAGCNPLYVHEGKRLWVPGKFKQVFNYFLSKNRLLYQFQIYILNLWETLTS